MINKRVTIIISLIVILTAILGLVAFSYAWYVLEYSQRTEFYLQADGFIIIYFDDEVEYSDIKLTPAVAMKDAIRDNKYMDVLREYNPNDPEPSYIEKTATVAHYEAIVNYYNGEENPVNNDIFIDIDAFVTLSESTQVPINLERELNIVISVTIEDLLGEEELIVIDDLKPGEVFSVTPQSIVEISLTAYLKLPDDLCAPALKERPLSFIVTVDSRV
ncbi:MAG: hypothetical protein GX242_01040 [Clostridiales bacterium]|nr:hypothetical protein [Clostridiales bacterium]